MKTNKGKKQVFLQARPAFVILLIFIAVLGCSIFNVRSGPSPEETEFLPTEAEDLLVATNEGGIDNEKLLQGLLTIENAKQNPGIESNQALRDYFAIIEPVKPKMAHDQAVNSVAFSPNNKWVASGSSDGTARVWDAATREEIARTIVDGAVKAVDFSPDSNWVAQAACEGFSEHSVNCGKAIVRVWEATTGREVFQLRADIALIALKFTLDGRKIIMTGNRQGIELWDLDSNAVSSPFKPDLAGAERFGRAGGYIYALDVDPHGRWFAAGSAVAVQVWDLGTGEEISRYPQGGYSVSFGRSEDVVASADQDIRIWDIKTGFEVITRIEVRPISERISSIEFSPDGEWIAAASDKFVRVWEVSTGREVSRMPFSGFVNEVSFSSDGKWIASGVDDGTVNISLWRSEDLIAEICSLLPRNFTHAEWEQYFGNKAYIPTCPNLPVPAN